jgi:hypothetical protein
LEGDHAGAVDHVSESAIRLTVRIAVLARHDRSSRDLSNVLASPFAASSSQFDDAMIPARSRRMTVAQLKERMDARFKTVDKRFDAVDKRFDAVDKRFDAVDRRFDAVDKRFVAVERRFDALEGHFARLFLSLESLSQQVASSKRTMKAAFDHHSKVLDEHDDRIKEVEASRKTRNRVQ